MSHGVLMVTAHLNWAHSHSEDLCYPVRVSYCKVTSIKTTHGAINFTILLNSIFFGSTLAMVQVWRVMGQKQRILPIGRINLKVFPSWSLNSYPFIYHFGQKREPSHIASIENGTPFTYLQRGYYASFLIFPCISHCLMCLLEMFWKALLNTLSSGSFPTLLCTQNHEILRFSYTVYSLKKAPRGGTCSLHDGGGGGGFRHFFGFKI